MTGAVTVGVGEGEGEGDFLLLATLSLELLLLPRSLLRVLPSPGTTCTVQSGQRKLLNISLYKTLITGQSLIGQFFALLKKQIGKRGN